MTRERFEERKRDAENAAKRLREVLTETDDKVVRDAAIQRFEFTFEAVWRALKLYLERQGFEVNSPRQVLKRAFSEGLIVDQAEADIWLMMLDDRNRTSHVYNEALADVIHQRIVTQYGVLLQRMAETLQKCEWD